MCDKMIDDMTNILIDSVGFDRDLRTRETSASQMCSKIQEVYIHRWIINRHIGKIVIEPVYS